MPTQSRKAEPPSPNLDRAIQDAGARVDRELDRLIRGEEAVEGLHEGLLYSLGLDQADPKIRGKRLRPVLCLLTAEALGANQTAALPFALAIELMHNFALVHDDIEDGDVMRRGRPCVHVKFGLPHGVNIGDYLFCKTLSALLLGPRSGLSRSTTLRLVELMSETLDHTHIGQALDISARSRRDLTLDDYFRLVREKTGYYLAAPMLGGAIVAGARKGILKTLSELGHSLGPLFQIQDDVIDLTEAKGRGVLGSDIREGKRSYCVVWTAGRVRPPEHERFWTILDKPRENTTETDVSWVISLFERVGAIDAARTECSRLHNEASRALARLPQPLQAVLTAFVERLARRKA